MYYYCASDVSIYAIEAVRSDITRVFLQAEAARQRGTITRSATQAEGDTVTASPELCAKTYTSYRICNVW